MKQFKIISILNVPDNWTLEDVKKLQIENEFNESITYEPI